MAKRVNYRIEEKTHAEQSRDRDFLWRFMAVFCEAAPVEEEYA